MNEDEPISEDYYLKGPEEKKGPSAFVLREEHERLLKEERNKAIDECAAKYSSLWINRIVSGLKPTPDEVLKALESLKTKISERLDLPH